MPRVSLVIAAYQSESTIADCLEALRAQRYRDFEVIAVDSSPNGATRELVRKRFPEFRLIESSTRLLPHEARNRGVAASQGELLVFTDADCAAEPEWLERLVEAHDAGHAIVCGSIEPPHRGGEAAEPGWYAIGVHLCKYSFRLSALSAGPCAIAGTANALYARTVWDVIGPFDGSRFAGDALLSWRGAQRGWQPWFEPRAIVRHRFEHATGALLRERFERGMEFAPARADFEGWSRARIAATVLATPLLPFIPLARGARDATRAGQLRRFAATLPIQWLGHAAWSLGEARGLYRTLKARRA
jgi:GT2 family glycosyltransferase